MWWENDNSGAIIPLTMELIHGFFDPITRPRSQPYTIFSTLASVLGGQIDIQMK